MSGNARIEYPWPTTVARAIKRLFRHPIESWRIIRKGMHPDRPSGGSDA